MYSNDTDHCDMYVVIASIFSTENINEMRCKNMVKRSVYFSFELSLSLNASNFMTQWSTHFITAMPNNNHWYEIYGMEK